MSIFKFTSLFRRSNHGPTIRPLINNINVSTHVNFKSVRNFSIKLPEKKITWKSQSDFEKRVKHLKSIHNFGTLDNINFQNFPKLKQFVKILQEDFTNSDNCDPNNNTDNRYLTGEQVYDILGPLNMLVFRSMIPKESRLLPKSQGVTRLGRNDIYCYEYQGSEFHVTGTDYREILNPSYLIAFLSQDIKTFQQKIDLISYSCANKV